MPCIWLLELNHSRTSTQSNQTFASSVIPPLMGSISLTTIPPDSESAERILTTMKFPTLKTRRMPSTQKPDLRLEEFLKTPQEFISKVKKKFSQKNPIKISFFRKSHETMFVPVVSNLSKTSTSPDATLPDGEGLDISVRTNEHYFGRRKSCCSFLFFFLLSRSSALDYRLKNGI